MARTTIRTEDITATEVTTAKVADNAVTLPKLEDGTQGDILYYGASGAPARLGFGTSGDFLKTLGTGANPVWASIPAGGLTIADQWRLTTGFSGTSNPITSNLERVDDPNQATLGSAMTESSGVFTFPETGYYWVIATMATGISSAAERSHGINISVTINASGAADWSNIANQTTNSYNSGDESTSGAATNLIVDVTATADVKVRFYATTVNGSSVTKGSTNDNLTYFTFIKLADT